jgi:UDP-N-acetyl-D-galactosamine dehydrogenase
VVDIYNGLREYTQNITICDPYADKEAVKHEYQIDITREIPQEQFDAIILAVAHNVFMSVDFKHLVKDPSVIYDVKGILPRDIIDGRL